MPEIKSQSIPNHSLSFSKFYFLEAIPKPAILVDGEANKILGVNEGFSNLTNYSFEELYKINPSDIITEFIGHNPDEIGDFGGRSLFCTIIDKSGGRNATKLNIFPYGDNEEWKLFVFEQILLEEKQDSPYLNLEAVSNLLSLMDNSSGDDESFYSIIKSIKFLTNSTFASYFQKAKSNKFIHVISQGAFENLPDTIGDTGKELLTPRIWDSTNRGSLPEFNLLFEDQSLKILITYPIIEGGKHIGLLLIGYKSTTQPENILKVLNSVAHAIAHFQSRKKPIQAGNIRKNSYAGNEYSIKEIIEDGIVILSANLHILDLNPAAQNYLGYSLEEAYDKPIGHIIMGSDLIKNALNMALQGAATHDMPAINLHRRNGDLFSAQVKVYPVLQSDGLYSVLIVIRDISEYEKIVERTRQLEQRAWLGNLTAIFAHEVRNPINNIKTGLQLMAEDMTEDDDNHKIIERLLNDCNRLNNLMEATLNYSRFGTYRFEHIDIVEMLNRIINHWQVKLIRSNVVSNIKSTTSKTTVYGDRRALDQVFQNIISNAIRVMGKQGGGVLSFHVQSQVTANDRELIKIDISDTGPGIPENVKNHIFDPFFTTNPDGTGLGLAITKQIITAHKGSIEVDSFPGGTVFKISLPFRSLENDSNNISH